MTNIEITNILFWTAISIATIFGFNVGRLVQTRECKKWMNEELQKFKDELREQFDRGF